MTSCFECPAGKYAYVGSYSTWCNSCPAGTYSAAGAPSCTSCAAGTYSSLATFPYQSTSSTCPAHSLAIQADQCEVLSTSLGVSFGGDETALTKPSGCVVSEGVAYFNRASDSVPCSSTYPCLCAPAQSSTGCTYCSAGRYSSAGATSCASCPPVSKHHPASTKYDLSDASFLDWAGIFLPIRGLDLLRLPRWFVLPRWRVHRHSLCFCGTYQLFELSLCTI